MNPKPGRIERVIGTPHGGRFASLEGYRAVAALSVVVYHARGSLDPLAVGARMDVVDNVGNFGVAVFFLLSGFLLYLPVSRRLFGGERQAPPGQFLLRRFVRIYPAYWLAVIGWAAVVETLGKQQVTPWKVFLLFDGSLRTLGVAWTLVIELWFYMGIAVLSVVLPRLLRRCRTRGTMLRAQLLLLVLMMVVAHGFRSYYTREPALSFHYASWVVGYLDWFAWGMLMAVLVAWTDHGGSLPASLRGLADHEWACFVVAALCYWTIMLVVHSHHSGTAPETRVQYMFRLSVQPIAALMLLIPATLGRRDQPVQRVLRRPVMASLGLVSYGIYLWHTVILRAIKGDPIGGVGGGVWWMLVNLLVVVAITLVIATLSYRLVERPALRLVPSTFERLLHREPLPFVAPADRPAPRADEVLQR